MPRVVRNALTVAKVMNAGPGRHPDGRNLYLLVSETGSRSWIFRYSFRGKSHEMGIGPAGPGGIGLHAARGEADRLRAMLRAGIDPLTERNAAAVRAKAAAAKAATAGITFKQAAEEYVEAHRPGWRSPKHISQWLHSIRVHCEPLHSIAVSAITAEDVMRVVLPLWNVKTETASRVRARIERVLSYSRVKGWRGNDDNPARWRGHFDHLVPKLRKVAPVKHFAAPPYAKLPELVQRMRQDDAMSARCLEFLILTASRSAEVRLATWSEIDLNAGIWTVPARRIKTGKEHKVPLGKRAVEILRALPRRQQPTDSIPRSDDSDHIFAGSTSETALYRAFRRAGSKGHTIHGLRSSFRDWAAEQTNFPREVCEAALAHSVGSVEAAYRRSDLVERRRSLMEAWAQFLDGQADNVVQLRPLSA